MKKPVVNFYLDFLSPYSYFAWLGHTDLPCDFKYLPIPMGSLFSHWEMKGPGQIPPKRDYLLKQCFIYAAKHGIEFKPPLSHPFNPLYVLRIADSQDGAMQKQLITLFFEAIWSRGMDLSSPDTIAELLQENGLSVELIDQATTNEVKQKLKSNVKRAIASRVFGVPSFECDGELFWGNDSLKLLREKLDGEMGDWDKKLYNSIIQRYNDLSP